MSAPRDPPPKNGTTVFHHEAVAETFTLQQPQPQQPQPQQPQPQQPQPQQPQPIAETIPLSDITNTHQNESTQFEFGLVDPKPQTDQDQLETPMSSNLNNLVNVGQPYVQLQPLDEIIKNQRQISTPENSQQSASEPSESPIVSVSIIIGPLP